MALGMEVGLSPGDFVLDGNPAPPKFSALVMVALWNRADHYIFILFLSFFFLSFFLA